MYISLMFRTKRRKMERLDFILAGAQKSGTTALHYFLSRHPDICMGDQQEIHFFDNDAMFVAQPNYEELHKHYPPMAPSTIAGDCTPSYTYHEPATAFVFVLQKLKGIRPLICHVDQLRIGRQMFRAMQPQQAFTRLTLATLLHGFLFGSAGAVMQDLIQQAQHLACFRLDCENVLTNVTAAAMITPHKIPMRNVRIILYPFISLPL